MREKVKGRRTLARGDREDSRGAPERQETAQGSAGPEGETHKRHLHTKNKDFIRGGKTQREWGDRTESRRVGLVEDRRVGRY